MKFILSHSGRAKAAFPLGNAAELAQARAALRRNGTKTATVYEGDPRGKYHSTGKVIAAAPVSRTKPAPKRRAAPSKRPAARKPAAPRKGNAGRRAPPSRKPNGGPHDHVNYMDGPEKGILPDEVKVVSSRLQKDGIHRWRKVTLRFKNPKDPMGYTFVHVAARDGIGGGLVGDIPAKNPAVRMAILSATDRACTGRNG